MDYNVFKPVDTKLYKTGQTRGADDDVIYQNRVKRNNTVLIPYAEFEQCKNAPTKEGKYENGFIVLIKPEDYFKEGIEAEFKKKGLKLGKNLLVFYETREQYTKFPIKPSWKPAKSRTSPLGGQYVARIPATTEKGKDKIIEGFNSSKLKGAGIRVYEYADDATISACRLQLEFLFWSCYDIDEFLKACSEEEATKLRSHMLEVKTDAGKPLKVIWIKFQDNLLRVRGLFFRCGYEVETVLGSRDDVCPYIVQHSRRLELDHQGEVKIDRFRIFLGYQLVS